MSRRDRKAQEQGQRLSSTVKVTAKDGQAKGSKERAPWSQMTADGDLKQTGHWGLSERSSNYFFLFWVIRTQVLICTVKYAPRVKIKKAQEHENNCPCQGIQFGRVGDASFRVFAQDSRESSLAPDMQAALATAERSVCPPELEDTSLHTLHLSGGIRGLSEASF